jgi:DnaJ-class molecular chaperone
LELKPGEVKCDKCKGTGIINNSTYVVELPGVKYTSTTSSESLIGIKCKKCKGEGKMDWIENVVGKKDRRTKAPIMNQGSSLPLDSHIGDMFYNYETHHMYKMTKYGWEQLPEPIKKNKIGSVLC